MFNLVKNISVNIMVKLLSYAGFNILVKPNDYVYIIHNRKPTKAKVTYIYLDGNGEFFFSTVREKISDNFCSCHFSVDDIGRYVFLTEKDALDSIEGNQE